MNAPPSAPRRIRSTPSSSSERYASLTDTRLVLYCRAISRSAGSLWPATSLPSEICFLIRRTIVSDTRPGRPVLANIVEVSRSAILLRIFRVVVKLEIETILRLRLVEARLHDDGRRQRRLRHLRLQERAAARRGKRNRRLAGDDAAREPFRNEGPRVVVVDVQSELRGRGMRRLEVPVIGRHDEVAAVLRVVIAVRPQRIFPDERAPVDRARAGIDLIHLRVQGTRERHR